MTDNVTTGNGSTEAAEVDDYMNSVLLRTALIVTYSVIFVLGVAGNTLVVYVVARNSMMQTITNVFIANLAVSDIMMCLLAVPFTPISGLLQAWPFGQVLCHLVPMTLGVSVYVSTLTSTAIAVDRYCVIVHPFLRRMHISACLVLIAVIWLTAVSISMPLALYQHLVWIADGKFYSCEENWPNPASRQLFTIISIVLQYVVPCIVIIYCYARVSLALRRRARRAIGNNSRRSTCMTDDEHGELRSRMRLRRKRRTNRMLIAMVAIFAVCWLPLNVILLSLEYDESLGASPYFLLVFFAAHVIAMSSTVYNPFLYAWMNDNFRKEFRLVFPCLRTPTSCRGAAHSLPYDTTMPVVVQFNAKHHSPSRYSSAMCRSEQQAASGDRNQPDIARGRRALLYADDQELNFIDAVDSYNNNGDNNDNVGVDNMPANAVNGGQPDHIFCENARAVAGTI